MFFRMGHTALTVPVVVTLTLVFSPEAARAQGRCGQQQGRLFPTGSPRQYPPFQQPGGLAQLAALRQQQAMLTALQLQQQQIAVLAAMQQEQPVQIPQPAAQPRVLQAALRRPMPIADDPAPAPQPEDPDVAADRKLSFVRDLLSDATSAQFQGEGDRATRMRARAVDRLHEIIAKYPGTRAADKAQELLNKVAP